MGDNPRRLRINIMRDDQNMPFMIVMDDIIDDTIISRLKIHRALSSGDWEEFNMAAHGTIDVVSRDIQCDESRIRISVGRQWIQIDTIINGMDEVIYRIPSAISFDALRSARNVMLEYEEKL